ncbi:MAG: hypothetical protein BWY74_00071 [Firmicutes bacterium ADurb.Bin419]|nr:MAG: hypothetical protein BWY74_00071 [Firmicutes bacterium ADurb.Bin419]
MLVDSFKTYIFPYLAQIGLILFVFAVCQSAYSLYRNPDWQKFIDKLKASVIAYAVVKGAFTIAAFIDSIISGIKLG